MFVVIIYSPIAEVFFAICLSKFVCIEIIIHTLVFIFIYHSFAWNTKNKMQNICDIVWNQSEMSFSHAFSEMDVCVFVFIICP